MQNFLFLFGILRQFDFEIKIILFKLFWFEFGSKLCFFYDLLLPSNLIYIYYSSKMVTYLKMRYTFYSFIETYSLIWESL